MVMAAAACIALPSKTIAAAQLNVKDLAQYGLVLIPATDNRFDGYLGSLLGGNTDAVIEETKPFAVILVNQSGSDVLAYSLRWQWTGASGRTTFHDVLYSNLSTPTLSSYRISSGGAAFVSLFFAVVKYNGPASLSPSQGQRQSLMAGQAAVTISLDGVLFADGRYVGPDETSGYSKAVALTEGNAAFLDELLAKHGGGETDGAVFAWVEAVANQMPSAGPSGIGSLDWSLAMKRQTAHVLLTTYHNSGAPAAYELASRLRPPNLQKIARVEYVEH
jgi:hypothetical protein